MRATPSGRRDPLGAADALILAILILASAGVCTAAILRRPDINADIKFLFSDPGLTLLITDRLAEGARLYRDIAFSYGPLAIQPYRLFAAIFGNTPQALSAFLAAMSAVNVGLAYLALRTRVSRRTAILVVIAGLFPSLLLPGSLIFGVQSSAYFGVERALFMAVLLAWQPPGTRRPHHAATVGILLGLMQGVRFGTAVFLGGAIILIDLLALHVEGASRRTVVVWLRLSLVTLASFLAVEAAWAAWAFATLPRADAIDFLWPSYVLEAFDALPGEWRWPQWGGIRLFIGQQLVSVVSCALAGIVLFDLVRRRDTDGGARAADLRLFVPIAFFALGVVLFFRFAHHFNQYAWTLPLGAAVTLERGRRAVTWMFAALTAPAVALLLRANLLTSVAPTAVTLRPPAGGHLVLTPVEARRTEALVAHIRTLGGRSPLIVRNGAGLHALFDIPYPARQAFYILGFARAGDEERTLAMLDRGASSVILTDLPAGSVPAADPCEWYGWPQFRAPFCGRLQQRLDMTRAFRVDDTTWIIPTRPGGTVPGGTLAPPTSP